MLVFHHEKSLSPEKIVAILLRMSTVDFTGTGVAVEPGNTNSKT